jgi:hypothetical protein
MDAAFELCFFLRDDHICLVAVYTCSSAKGSLLRLLHTFQAANVADSFA